MSGMNSWTEEDIRRMANEECLKMLDGYQVYFEGHSTPEGPDESGGSLNEKRRAWRTPMTDTKPGMPSLALTEADVRRIISEFVAQCCVQVISGDLVINRIDYERWLTYHFPDALQATPKESEQDRTDD